MNWLTLTNEEIKNAVRKIVFFCNSVETMRERIRDELQYPYNVAIHAVDHYGSLMVMGMMHGHGGEIISF